MTEDDLTYLPLKVVRTGVGGKRTFDSEGERRLIEACTRPGVSISKMALRAGINAKQLRKWIREHKRMNTVALSDVGPVLPAFVPVVEISGGAPELAEPDMASTIRREVAGSSQRMAPSARLTAHLQNGVRDELECGGRDIGIVKAMIEALWAR